MRFLIVLLAALLSCSMAFSFSKNPSRMTTQSHRSSLVMKFNDPFTRANRAARTAGADDRVVELLLPLGIELDEDKDGNVFVKSIEKNSRAEKSGKVFVGDIVAMASATFGDDMWSCRGVGLGRVLTTIKSRNNRPVKLALEAPNEMEQKRRNAIAFKELTEKEKEEQRKKDEMLLEQLNQDDKSLLKKRKGFLGLW